MRKSIGLLIGTAIAFGSFDLFSTSSDYTVLPSRSRHIKRILTKKQRKARDRSKRARLARRLNRI